MINYQIERTQQHDRMREANRRRVRQLLHRCQDINLEMRRLVQIWSRSTALR